MFSEEMPDAIKRLDPLAQKRWLKIKNRFESIETKMASLDQLRIQLQRQKNEVMDDFKQFWKQYDEHC